MNRFNTYRVHKDELKGIFLVESEKYLLSRIFLEKSIEIIQMRFPHKCLLIFVEYDSIFGYRKLYSESYVDSVKVKTAKNTPSYDRSN